MPKRIVATHPDQAEAAHKIAGVLERQGYEVEVSLDRYTPNGQLFVLDPDYLFPPFEEGLRV